MKNHYIENAIKTRAVYCTDEGVVFVEDLVRKQILYKFDIFGDRYKYLLYNWLIGPCFFFSPDEKWLIITYGMGIRLIVFFISRSNQFLYFFFLIII